MLKKLIIVIIVVVLLLLGLIYLITRQSTPVVEEPTLEESIVEESTIEEPTVEELVNEKPAQDPWSVLQQTISYAKNKDINGINTIFYKPLPPCSDAQECSEILDFIYNMVSQLNEKDFVNRWEDSKQIILSTNPKKDDYLEAKRYKKDYIYFTKDDSGNLKLLSLILGKTWSHTTKNTNLTEAQIEQELQKMMLDTDQDGLTDMEETCSGGEQYNPECVKTDPLKRDTDGNGWWDGTEKKF